MRCPPGVRRQRLARGFFDRQISKTRLVLQKNVILTKTPYVACRAHREKDGPTDQTPEDFGAHFRRDDGNFSCFCFSHPLDSSSSARAPLVAALIRARARERHTTASRRADAARGGGRLVRRDRRRRRRARRARRHRSDIDPGEENRSSRWQRRGASRTRRSPPTRATIRVRVRRQSRGRTQLVASHRRASLRRVPSRPPRAPSTPFLARRRRSSLRQTPFLI